MAPQLMPGGTRRVGKILDVSREDPRESVDTYRLARVALVHSSSPVKLTVDR